MKSLISRFAVFFLLLPMSVAPVRSTEKVEIPFRLAQGQLLYENFCSSCHGLQLNGFDNDPPLVHPFHKPSHHDDKSFYRAALKGVRQHHWEFGDMPPVVGITPGKLDRIVPYLRYCQRRKKLY